MTDDQAQALAAWAEWNLGDSSWANQVAVVLANPHAIREALKGEGLSVADIDAAFRQAFPDRHGRRKR
jgi:hypothetical protein